MIGAAPPAVNLATNGWTIFAAIATAVAAIVTGALAFFTWRMARATSTVATETRNMATATTAMASATETALRQEIIVRSSAAIAVTFERGAGPQAEWHLVIENNGLGEARDVDLLKFNSRADGRNARHLLDIDPHVFPVRRIVGGGRVHLPVFLAKEDPGPPWEVEVQWTDGRGPQLLEDLTVTSAP